MNNKWKKAFFALLIVIVIVIIVVFGLFFKFVGTSGSSSEVPNNTPHVDSPIFMIQANKKRLNDMINNELQKHQPGHLAYSVSLNQDVTLKGSLGVLGLKIPFRMSFDPEVKNGDIILKETSVSLAKISLPEEEVLKFIKKGTDLPDWVIVQSDKNQIYVNLTKMELKGRFYLKAKRIDLQENKIEFNVYQK